MLPPPLPPSKPPHLPSLRKDNGIFFRNIFYFSVGTSILGFIFDTIDWAQGQVELCDHHGSAPCTFVLYSSSHLQFYCALLYQLLKLFLIPAILYLIWQQRKGHKGN